MKIMKIKTNKGFTLAEMLIVVAIIGVLIAIVATTINDKLVYTRQTTDNANIKIIYNEAINQYLITNKKVVRWVKTPMKADYDGATRYENLALNDSEKWVKGNYIRITIGSDGLGYITRFTSLGSDAG